MKNIALHTIHKSLGAKMVPFAGYNMPVQYEGVTAEHHTVRDSVGVFDVSHMGQLILSGDDDGVDVAARWKRWFRATFRRWPKGGCATPCCLPMMAGCWMI